MQMAAGLELLVPPEPKHIIQLACWLFLAFMADRALKQQRGPSSLICLQARHFSAFDGSGNLLLTAGGVWITVAGIVSVGGRGLLGCGSPM